MKRTLTASAAALLGGLLLVTAALAEVTITLSGSGNAQNVALFEQWAAAYNAQSDGVTVKWISGPREASDFQQQLLRDSLVGRQLPDVVLFTGPLLRVLHERGLVASLSPLIKADARWNDNFSSSVSAPGTIGGETYGLAYGVSMPVAVFNAELVKQVGGDPANLPRDWPGILGLAKKIDGLGPNVVGGFIEHDNGIGFSWLTVLEGYGGTVMDASDKTFTFGGPEGLKALQLLRDFGEVGQAKADMTRDQARQAFGAGGIGVMVSMSSLISRYEKQAQGKFDVVSVPYPLAPGQGKIPVSAVIAAMLTRDPAAQKAAFNFMKFVARPTGQIALATATGYAPTNQRAIEQSPELQKVLATRANAHAYLDNLPAVTGWYLVPGNNGLRVADMFTDHLQQVVTLDEAPELALQSMKSEAESLVAQ